MFKRILPYLSLAAVVLGWPLAASTGDFTPPQSYNAKRLAKQVKKACPSKQWDCFEKELFGLIKPYGPRGAVDTFKRLRDLGDIDIRVDPHHFVHHVGHHTAMTFGSNAQAFALCTPEFHAGCFHGFFQHMLGMGSPSSEDAAIGICDTMQKDPSVLPEVKFSCYHGLGHGFLMYKKYNLQAALKACEKLPVGPPQDGCWQGLFMENINGSQAGKWKECHFSMKDPLQPCNKLPSKYQYQCYINHSSWLISFHQGDVQKATQSCLKAQGTMAKPCMASIGLSVTNPSWQPNLLPGSIPGKIAENAWAICQKFPKGYLSECVIPGIDNLMITNNLDVATSDQLCMLTNEPLRSDCFKQIGMRLHYLTGNAQTSRNRCQTVNVQGQTSCLQGIGPA